LNPKAIYIQRFTFPDCEGSCEMPLLSFKFSEPVAGYPPRVQWARWAQSIWFGYERFREPLEVHNVASLGLGEKLWPGSVSFTKGYTRASILAFGILQTLLVEDMESLTEAEREFFTTRLVCTKCFWNNLI
jgi:hypothetical protein